MTADELADKLREALENAPERQKNMAYITFGMKYADHLGWGAVSIRQVCRLAQATSAGKGRIQQGRQLVQAGHATLNEDTLWF